MRLSANEKSNPENWGRVEVALRSLLVRYREISGSLAAGLRRLIGGAQLQPQAYALRMRLVGTLLASPFILTCAVAVVLPTVAGPGLVVATTCAIFALTWLAGLYVAQHGRESAVSLPMLVLGAVLLALLTAIGGGLGSPLALLLAAAAFEPWWICRTRRAARTGMAVAALAIAATAGFSFAVPGAVTAAVAWYWLPTTLYLFAVGCRVDWRHDDQQREAPLLEDRMGAAVLHLAANGDIRHVSARSADVLGIPSDLLTDQALFDRLHVGDRVAYMCALSEVRNGATARQMEIRVRLPGNSEQNVYRLVMAEIVGTETGPQIILRPAHEIQDLRLKLVEARDEVDRLTMAKSSFLASVSHELRTPLNAIIGFSDMLVHELYGKFADARQREHVLLIREAGSHLLDVVNSILYVSKIELGAYDINPEPFLLENAVTMCASMMSVQAGAKHIELKTSIDPSVGEVNADRRAVQQILINLVSNAVKFTPHHGKVTIECVRDGDAIELVVRDNGIGIAESDMARLGQPFVQLSTDFSRRYEGTGLGLALVKGLVQLHGGDLSVASTLGSGTTVTIRMPAAAAGEATCMPYQIEDGEIDGAYRKTA